MTRALSPTALSAVLAQDTGEAFLMLVSFTHTPTSETFRCVLNTEDITSRGDVYTATYFEVSLPEESDKAPQGCTITVDNVDLMLVALLRRITQPLNVTIEVVLASSPSTVELSLTDLVLREVTWNEQTLTGTLSSDDPLNQRFPSHIYEPRTFPGIF